MRSVFLKVLLYSITVLQFEPSYAEELRVAVASNFADTLAEIARGFERDTGQAVTVIRGSTGKLYAQIVNGAPFDVFLAADSYRPELLENDSRAIKGSRFSYAAGRLVLWSPDSGLVDREGKILTNDDFRYLAIANPKLAPYGQAARETLIRLGLWGSLQDRIVRGESIGQTYQFVASGNAALGLIARSQLPVSNRTRQGSFWEVPASLHDPILQQGILLNDTQSARSFLEYMKTPPAQAIIIASGYDLPKQN